MVRITKQSHRNSIFFCNLLNNADYRTGICINKNLHIFSYFNYI